MCDPEAVVTNTHRHISDIFMLHSYFRENRLRGAWQGCPAHLSAQQQLCDSHHSATLPAMNQPQLPGQRTQRILFLEGLSISLSQNQPFPRHPKGCPSSRAHMEAQLTADISLLGKARRAEPGLSVSNAKNQSHSVSRGVRGCALSRENGKFSLNSWLERSVGEK